MNYAVIKARGVAEPCEEAGDAAGADEFGKNLIKTIKIYKWFGGNFSLFIWTAKLKLFHRSGYTELIGEL